MSKKKAELTLEELQARKSKRQRGWVRVCAIILAIVLTGGVYGLAAKGGPRKQKYAPSVVQVNGGTVVQKEESKAPAEEAPAPAPAPSTSEEEGGGILDTLMGLISGIDFGSLIEKLNPGQLGITVADKIDVFKDNLLDKINEFQGSINKKPVITHEAVVEEFPAVEMTEEQELLNTDASKKVALGLLKTYTAGVVEGKKAYTLTRNTQFAPNGNVNIGSKTGMVNTILDKASKGTVTLDKIVGEIAGVYSSTVSVEENQNLDQAIKAAFPDGKEPSIPFLLANELHTIDLAPEDIWIESFDDYYKTYTIHLKSVANPNRETVCGLTKVTKDYLVQNEVASLLQSKASIQGTNFGVLKLTDLNIKYTDVVIELNLDPGYESIAVSYVGDAQFVVRTNTVQVTGKTATTTRVEYKFA